MFDRILNTLLMIWSVFKRNQISKIELLAKIVKGFQPVTIFTKSSFLGVWLGSEYTFLAINE